MGDFTRRKELNFTDGFILNLITHTATLAA